MRTPRNRMDESRLKEVIGARDGKRRRNNPEEKVLQALIKPQEKLEFC